MRRGRRRTHSLLSLGGLLIIATFAIWWFNFQHVPNNFGGFNHTFDYILFLILSYVIWHPLVMEVLSWAIASNIKDSEHPEPAPNLKVAFITTFVPQSESIELLEKTLPAMVAVDYEHDTWVLDEGNDPRVSELCAKLGVRHYSRHGIDYFNSIEGKYARKTKGGNHNSWYDSYGNDYDIVAQMDTDFVPDPSYLTKTLGYFQDPSVAFVGTPQVYGNTDNSLIARGAAQQTYNFYGPILRGLFGMDTTLLIGANHVIRVTALKDVNHYSAHITEDLLTGMKLHARGWKSVYVPEPLAYGEGPTTWQAYFNQQMRWAYGCIDVLFRFSPKLFRRMKFRRSIYYFFIQQHYFSGLAMALSIFGISLYALFGINTANISFWRFTEAYLPVIITIGLMYLWMQRYNVRPKLERGLHIAGMIVSLASWPVFFLALIGVLRRKRLTYKVTPKGHDYEDTTSSLLSFRIFKAHLFISIFSFTCLLIALVTNHRSPIMISWMAVSGTLMLVLPFVLIIEQSIDVTGSLWHKFRSTLGDRYLFFELSGKTEEWLPGDVTDQEKYRYLKRRHKAYMIFSILSLAAISFGFTNFLKTEVSMWPLWLFFFVTLDYFLVSFIVSVKTDDFDFAKHQRLITNWHPEEFPSVDIFLPIAGESINVINNTWLGVVELYRHYPGLIKVYCLDDGASDEVRLLAKKFEFEYLARPNSGEYRKAGNLQYGLSASSGQYVVIFDADFRPRYDFLDELLPYFYQNERVGIVQSPQYFDVHPDQGWLERGAGAVQELFYRYTQVSRQHYDASICVGSNAVYSRDALDSSGGFALIDHSEDVHTGFNLKRNGWKLQYVPIILAKGLCPANLTAFFKQQYRWCLGSLSLISSNKFWKTKLPWRNRLSYYSGFLYYLHTAINSLFVPIVPIIILLRFPEQITWTNYLYVLPSLILLQVFYPLWHDATYGMEAWSIRMVAGWAHLFAIFDSLVGRSKNWLPSGSKVTKDFGYDVFRGLQLVFNFMPATLWVILAINRMFAVSNPLVMLPMLISGLYFWLITAKVSFYTTKPGLGFKRPMPTALLLRFVNATGNSS